MSLRHTKSISMIVALFFLCGCRSDTITTPSSSQNFISNSSFESDGAPTMAGWKPNLEDTAFVNFSSEAPAGGGSYSVRLRNEWTVPGSVSYRIIPEVGTHRYKLSAFAKTSRSNGTPILVGGDLMLLVSDSGNWSTRKSLHFSDSTWKSGTLLDTITTTPSDTIMVLLRGNLDQWSSGYILFDLCRFEKLD